MQCFSYLRPTSIEELLLELYENDGRILAGGTDILPRLRKGFKFEDLLIDISGIDALNYINSNDSSVSIGSVVTYNEIINSDIIKKFAPILISAASVVGAYQTRQRGTIGGSIGNASPASDIILPLLSLNAELVILGMRYERTVALIDFILGPGKIDLRKGEVIKEIRFLKTQGNMRYFFNKQGKRNAMACAVVNLAMLSIFEKNNPTDIRIAIGSVAPKPIRCIKTEDFIKNNLLTKEIIIEAGKRAVQESSPICDIRASADFRRYLVKQLVITGLKKLNGN